MTIMLYQNHSEMNRVDKSITLMDTLDGTLRESCSILEPSVTVRLSYAPKFINYMFIEEFERYYFITDIVSISSDLWVISGHVDVLGTYKTWIRNLYAIVNRQENSYNLYLDDDKFLINAQRKIWTKAFPNSAPAAAGKASVILTVAGGPGIYTAPTTPPQS